LLPVSQRVFIDIAELIDPPKAGIYIYRSTKDHLQEAATGIFEVDVESARSTQLRRQQQQQQQQQRRQYQKKANEQG
jgi:hypothetical protein